jgi:hypothetical protein
MYNIMHEVEEEIPECADDFTARHESEMCKSSATA